MGLRKSGRSRARTCEKACARTLKGVKYTEWVKCVCISKGAIGEMIEDAAADVHKEVQHIIRRLCVCTYKARAQVLGDVSIGTSDKTGAMLF